MSTDRRGNDHTSPALDRTSETRDTMPATEGAARSANLERADGAAPREDQTGRLHQAKDWARHAWKDTVITTTVVMGLSGAAVAGHLDDHPTPQSDKQTSGLTIRAATESDGEHHDQESTADRLVEVVEHQSEHFHEAYEPLEARRKAEEDVATNPDGDPVVIDPDV